MAITANIRAFRLSRASDLESFARVLQRTCNCDTSPIFEAASQLRDFTYVPKINPNDTINYDFWGYDTGDLVFYFEKIPRHTYPENTTNMSLSLSVKLIADVKSFKQIADPYVHLELNIVAQGTCFDGNNPIELITSFHLDRHLHNPEDNEPEDVHPIYHFQFGGRKLNKKYRNFGNSLLLDSPRIVHYPMDIILGVDFVLSNFFPHYWKKLRQDGEYVNVLRDYQDYFWKPYAHSKAFNWIPYEEKNVNWEPVQIWPHLIV